MNTIDLAREIATVTGLRISAAEGVIRYTFAKIAETMAKGDVVKIHNFGNFGVSQRPARDGINPQTREKIAVPALKSGRWAVSAMVKDAINGRMKLPDLYDGIDLHPVKSAKTATATPATATPATTTPATTAAKAVPQASAKVNPPKAPAAPTGQKIQKPAGVGAPLPPPPPPSPEKGK